jgi:hypothetical protein
MGPLQRRFCFARVVYSNYAAQSHSSQLLTHLWHCAVKIDFLTESMEYSFSGCPLNVGHEALTPVSNLLLLKFY